MAVKNNHDWLRAPYVDGMIHIGDAVQAVGCSPMYSPLRAVAKKICKHYYVDPVDLGNVLTLYEERKIIGKHPPPSDGLIPIVEAAEIIGCSQSFRPLQSFIEREGRYKYISALNLGNVLTFYEEKISRRIKSRAPDVPGMLSISNAAKKIGCSLGYRQLKKECESIGGHLYLPEHKIQPLRGSYNRERHEQKERKQSESYQKDFKEFLGEINNLVDKAGAARARKSRSTLVKRSSSSQVDPSQSNITLERTVKILSLLPGVIKRHDAMFSARLKDLEKELLLAQKTVAAGFNGTTGTSSGNGSKSDTRILSEVDKRTDEAINRLYSINKSFIQDLSNQQEYFLNKLRQTAITEIDSVFREANERIFGKFEGDYYKGTRLADFASTEYQYLKLSLNAIQSFGRGNFQFLKGVRWLMGENPQNSQIDAVDALGSIIFAIRSYYSAIQPEYVYSFMDAVAGCDGKQRKPICKVLKAHKNKIENCTGANIRQKVQDLIDDLDGATTGVRRIKEEL